MAVKIHITIAVLVNLNEAIHHSIHKLKSIDANFGNFADVFSDAFDRLGHKNY
jgi:hypothetical protein